MRIGMGTRKISLEVRMFFSSLCVCVCGGGGGGGAAKVFHWDSKQENKSEPLRAPISHNVHTDLLVG